MAERENYTDEFKVMIKDRKSISLEGDTLTTCL